MQIEKRCAKLKGTAPAHPCARGVPFILNITVRPEHKKPHHCVVGLKMVSARGK